MARKFLTARQGVAVALTYLMRKKSVALTLIISAFCFQNCSQQVAFETFELSSVAPLCTDLSPEAFAPKVKWDWYSQLPAGDFPEFSQVMATPTVGDLDGDGKPEIVFVSWSVSATDTYSGRGVLRILSGSTGKTVKSVGDLALAPGASTTPLLIDIDGDGKVEIFYSHHERRAMVALNHDGSRRWVYEIPDLPAGVNLHNYRGFSAFDLDKDGKAEIIFGQQAISENSTGQPVQKWKGSEWVSVGYSFAMNLDPSQPGLVRIVSSNGIYDLSGAKVHSLPSASYSAANIDNIPGIELVGTLGGYLRIIDGVTGEVKLNKDLSVYNELQCPGGVGGGPATLGDFDGNIATTEIAVATGRYLTIFDGSGSIVAKFPTQDCSSLSTGISSFDFNGDGKPEILYGDEEYLRVFELVNNELKVVWQTVNPSGTLHEYPVVADVDGNGSSELVVVSNNYAVGGFYAEADQIADREVAKTITGIRVFEPSVANAWMPTRSLWNSFDYNPAFVTDRLRAVSSTSLDSFTSKLFRRNAQLGMFEKQCVSVR